MLVELGLVEQRYQAVLEVLNDGATVTDVSRRYGVARQTVHVWPTIYASQGLRGLADRSSKPLSCPHQMDPVIEARIVEMRHEHPDRGSPTILYWLAQEGVDPLPGRTSVDRCLLRHELVNPQPRRRKRSDYKRWERSRGSLIGSAREGSGRVTTPPCGVLTLGSRALGHLRGRDPLSSESAFNRVRERPDKASVCAGADVVSYNVPSDPRERLSSARGAPRQHVRVPLGLGGR